MLAAYVETATPAGILSEGTQPAIVIWSRLMLPRHAAIGCPARSRLEHSSKIGLPWATISGDQRSDGNQDRRPSVSFDSNSLAKSSDTKFRQPYSEPARSTIPADIRQGPPADAINFPTDVDWHLPLLTLPDNGSPQQPQNEICDQPRLESIQRMAQADISQRSSAISTYCPSPETASSMEASLCADSEESSSFLAHRDSHLVYLHSKHRLLVDLMQEVYAIFDQRWGAKLQAHAGSSPPNTPLSNQNTPSDHSRKGKKRSRDDRDFTPPNDAGSSKRPRREISSNSEKQNDPFACPFHKNEPAKYCCSVVDGSRYRACVGPGFASIARLK